MPQDLSLRIPIAISLGAIAGALSRYYITLWFVQKFGTLFPYGTFFINLTGCFAMGLFVTIAFDRSLILSPEVRLFVTTGFLGAYTTFSTYGLETVNLIKLKNLSAAGFYGLGSVVLGAIAVWLGMMVGRMRWGG